MGYEILALAFATAVFVAVVVGFIVAYRVDAADRAAIADGWARWARGAGHRYEAPSGGWPVETPPRVEIDTPRGPVTITVVRHRGTPHTKVLLAPPRTLLGRLLVATTPFDDRTYARTTGDPGFDARFHVVANPLAVQERVLGADLRRRLQAFSLGRYLRFAFARGRISLVWEGVEESVTRLEEAMALVSDVASALFPDSQPSPSSTAPSVGRTRPPARATPSRS